VVEPPSVGANDGATDVSPAALLPVAISDCRPRFRAAILASRDLRAFSSSCSSIGGGSGAGGGAGIDGELNPTTVIKVRKSMITL
tara:strand:+ start:45 stop:299 length:255 start_codon:yes stop_codon:yes gene_type:complete